MKSLKQIKEAQSSNRYPMTYLKGHKDDKGKTYFEKLHTYIDFPEDEPKSSRTGPERTSYLVAHSPKHKELKSRGYSIHKYGEHDEDKDHYTMPVKIVKDLNEDAQQNYLAKFDPREKPGYPSDKQIPNVLMLQRKSIRVFPDHQKVAMYYAPAIDKYITVPFGIGGATGIPTMFREELSEEVFTKVPDKEASSNTSSKSVAASLIKKKTVVAVKPKGTDTSVPTVPKKKGKTDYFAGGDWFGIGHAAGAATGKLTGHLFGKIKSKFAGKSPVPNETTPEPIATTHNPNPPSSPAYVKQRELKPETPPTPEKKITPTPPKAKTNPVAPPPPTPAPGTSEIEKIFANPAPERKTVKSFMRKTKPVAGTGEQPHTSELNFPGREKPKISLGRKRYNFDPKAPGIGEQPKVKNVIRRKKKVLALREKEEEEEDSVGHKVTDALIPGKSAVRNIMKGNYKDAAIDAAIDVGSIGLGIASGGTGYLPARAAGVAVRAGRVAAKTGTAAAKTGGNAVATTGAKTTRQIGARIQARQAGAGRGAARTGAASKATGKGRWGKIGRTGAGLGAAGLLGGLAGRAGKGHEQIKPHEYNFGPNKTTTSRAPTVTSQGNVGFNSPAQQLLYQKSIIREDDSSK